MDTERETPDATGPTADEPEQGDAAEEAADDGGATHVNDGDPVEEPTEGTGDVPDAPE